MKEPKAEPIPGYRLIEPLGSGGFGEVWKCEAPGGLFKAIKFVHGGDNDLLGDGPSSADQELRALQHVKSIRHPFLLSMDRVEHVAGELVIVMELADKSLHDLLEENLKAGRPGVPRVDLLLYLRETAEVLDLMNLEHGLEHLDIKPRNLFLVGGHVKVADFGLVNSLAGQSVQLGAVTPVYASPECFQGRFTLYSDQYSLAIVYCELLTGKVPFPGKNFRQLMLQHVGGEPDLSALPEGDRPVVARALAKDPGQRYPSSMDFVRDLIAQELPAVAPDSRAREATLHDIQIVENRRTKAIARPTRFLQKEQPKEASPVQAIEAPEAPDFSVDDFHFRDCLGRSALGEMWKVETPDGSVRLLKLVNTFSQNGLFGEDDPVTRLRTIQHPGLLPTEVAAYPPNRLALVTPLTTSNLATRMQEAREKGLPGIQREELLEFLRPVAETLDALQKTYGVQHLGLGPRSLVFLDEQLHVADYGLVGLVWLPTGQDIGQINPRYSAPELFDRNPGARGKVDFSPLKNCDQYSLALIYHELLTGFHLFGNMTQRQLALARSAGRLNLDQLTAPDRPAVARATNPEAGQRFRSCTDFIRALIAVGSERSEGNALTDTEGGRSALTSRLPSGARRVLPANSSASRPVLCLGDVLQSGTEQVIAELVAGAGGATEMREYRSARCVVQPGRSIEHSCYARLVPGTLKLKLVGFREQWPTELTEQGADHFVFRVRLQSSFWRRCLGREPGLEVQVRAQSPRFAHVTMTDVLIRVTPSNCGADEGAVALERMGPLLIDSLRTHIQVGPERRAHVRLPFTQTVEAMPVLANEELGEPLVCQCKDISLGGMGLTLPCRPPSHLVLQLPRPSRGVMVPVAAEVVRSLPCADGRYEVGVKFLSD